MSKQLLDLAFKEGINIVCANNNKDKNRVGIHLLYPNIQELEHAVYRAANNNFKTIVVHSKETWHN